MSKLNYYIVSGGCVFLFIYLLLFFFTMWVIRWNLWSKGDHLMETSYLKAHPFGNRYPEWMPNLPSDRGQDSNPCAWGTLGPHSAHGSTVPRRPSVTFTYLFSMSLYSLI